MGYTGLFVCRVFHFIILVNGNHWVRIHLTGVVSNRTAIGAKASVRATIGGSEVRQLREVSSQNTFNGHDSLNVHFGLGDAAIVDSLVVEWPSGIVQSLTDLAVDVFIEVVEAPELSAPPIPDGAWVPGAPLRVEKA